MPVTYLALDERIRHELVQAREEGKDVDAIAHLWENAPDAAPSGSTSADADRQRLAANLLDALAEVEDLGADREPSSLDRIQAARPAAIEPVHAGDPDTLHDRLLGGWLGRTAGCLLGKPVEKSTREGIRALLESSGQWPLHDYVTARGIPDDLLAAYPWNKYGGVESLRENIVAMPEDDDINYTLVNLHVLETFGPDVTPGNILTTWLDGLPVLTTFTAERVAYLNALHQRVPPETATYRNPYREWIGAQIRADIWGWTAPGNPELAAAMAWRDASVSHTKNGIYGAMFVAATLSACVSAAHPLDAVRVGLGQIPAESRLAEAIRFALDLPLQTSDWEDAVDRVHQRYGHYNWVHTVNNAALLVAAIAFGDGDYHRSICYTVMGGWDADSNGATVGAIVGTWAGAGRIPAAWTDPLRNTIRTSLKGFDHSAIDDLARRTAAQTLVSPAP